MSTWPRGCTPRRKFLFRGQTKSTDWPLVPLVGRNPRRSQCLHREVETLEEFKRESVPYLDFVPTTDWQWLALAQHNGLPTRLLDWSTNPLAGLWFAVKDCAIDSQPGIVWAFSYQESQAIFSTIHQPSPFSVTESKVYFPEHLYPLIGAQAGAFTVHHKACDPPGFPPLEESIENADLFLRKIEIPADCFPTMRHHLFRLNVSPASMWPGLRGLAERFATTTSYVATRPRFRGRLVHR